MGAYSELDIQQMQGDPFCDDSEVAAFSGMDGENILFGAAGEGSKQAATDAVPSPPPAASEQSQGDAPAAATASQNTSDADAKAKAEDDAARKAHEEAEAKRKAEWDARQQKKKEAEQEQLARLAKMSDEEVMTASMKRVYTDMERLTRRNMKEFVSEHIQTMCLDDPAFARRVMHPRKSMIHCIWYINRKAREFVEQEMKDNGIKPENGVYGSDVPDDLCYQWAVDYFNDPDAKEDKVETEKFVSKPYIGKPAASKSKSTPTTKAKKEPPKKVEAPRPQQKKAADTGQISLGGFMMPEAKAG